MQQFIVLDCYHFSAKHFNLSKRSVAPVSLEHHLFIARPQEKRVKSIRSKNSVFVPRQ